MPQGKGRNLRCVFLCKLVADTSEISRVSHPGLICQFQKMNSTVNLQIPHAQHRPFNPHLSPTKLLDEAKEIIPSQTRKDHAMESACKIAPIEEEMQVAGSGLSAPLVGAGRYEQTTIVDARSHYMLPALERRAGRAAQRDHIISLLIFITFIIISLTVPLAHGAAQTCDLSDVTFSTQEEIDSFPSDYPDCEEVSRLRIVATSTDDDIVNLDGLNGIKRVEGDVTIQALDQLTDLLGLSALEEIGGDLSIKDNHLLTELDGLQNLLKVGQRIEISENNSLINIDAISQIAGSIDNFIMFYNPELQTIHFPNQIDTIRADLLISGNPHLGLLDGAASLKSVRSLWLGGLSSLTTLQVHGFENLTEIVDRFEISEIANLDSLAAFQSLQRIGGNLTITENGGNFNFPEFAALQSIGNVLLVTNNSELTSVHAFDSLVDIGGNISIGNNDLLTSIRGFDSLQQMAGTCILNGEALLSIDGFSNLQHIGMNLTIYNGYALEHLGGFEQLDSIGGDLRIYDLRNIEQIAAFGSLRSVDYLLLSNLIKLSDVTFLNTLTEIKSSCFVAQNPLITDLRFLSAIESIPLLLQIDDMESLTALEGLENLQEIGTLRISNLPVLTDISQLSNLERLQSLQVLYNESLASISLLEDIDHDLIELVEIRDNAMLEDCELSWICDLLNQDHTNVQIRHNLEHCKNRESFAQHHCDIYEPDECFLFDLKLDWTYSFDSLYNDYPDCRIIKGDLTIGNLSVEENTESVLTEVRGDLEVIATSLTSQVTALANLHSIGGSFSFWQPNLDTLDLQSLGNLEFLGNNFSIADCANLHKINNSLNLKHIPGDLTISRNAVLQSPIGLSALEEVGENIIITDNNRLQNCEGLNGLASVNGFVEIARNPALINLTGLDSLSRIDKYLFIQENHQMQSLQGLLALDSIGRHLQVFNNRMLDNLDGLEQLRIIDQKLQIVGNDSLSNIEGLANLDVTLLTDMLIKDNASLESCKVNFVCDFIDYNLDASIIETNALGCVSTTEVALQCDSLANNTIAGEALFDFSIYPNPTENSLYINPRPAPGSSYYIVNMLGEPVLSGTLKQSQIKLDQLSNGCYLLVLISDSNSYNRKFVIAR